MDINTFDIYIKTFICLYNYYKIHVNKSHKLIDNDEIIFQGIKNTVILCIDWTLRPW